MSEYQDQALKLYENCKNFLTEREINFEELEEALRLDFSLSGEDIPVKFRIIFNGDLGIIKMYSPMSFSVPEDVEYEMMKSLTYINDSLVDGSFDYSLEDNGVCYRMCTCFRDSILSDSVLQYIVGFTFGAVDEYNDKLLMVAKGVMKSSDIKEYVDAE